MRLKKRIFKTHENVISWRKHGSTTTMTFVTYDNITTDSLTQ